MFIAAGSGANVLKICNERASKIKEKKNLPFSLNAIRSTSFDK